MATARRIRGRYYAIVGLYNLSASLIWGINTLFLLEAGLDLFETFVANAFFTAGQVLFEIPTGVAADTAGRRFSLLASTIILALSTLGYVVLYATAGGVVLFSIASIFLGLGFTFYSGAVEAWVVDALQHVDPGADVDAVLARGAQMFGASLLVGTISGGLLGQIHLAWPYILRALLLVGLFVLAFWGMHDVGFEKRPFRWHQVPAQTREIFSSSIRHGWRNAPVRLVMLMSLLHMGFLMWGWYAWQPYFLHLLGRDLVWVAGLIAAALGLMMVTGGQIARQVGPRLRRSTAIAAGAAVFAAGMAATGLAATFPVAVASFLVGMLGLAFVQPIAMAAMHSCIPSSTRATVVSFNSLMGSAGGVVSQPVLGAYTRAVGIGAGYVVGGIMTAPVILLGLLLRRHPEADRRRPVDKHPAVPAGR